MAGKSTTSSDDHNEHETPLGAFLLAARDHAKMSRREAARRADISESRYRQVELGYQQVSPDVRVPVSPKPETVAAMARAVDADVAEALRLGGFDPERYARLVKVDPTPSAQDYDWFVAMSREEREAVLAELQRLHLDAELSQQRRAG